MKLGSVKASVEKLLAFLGYGVLVKTSAQPAKLSTWAQSGRYVSKKTVGSFSEKKDRIVQFSPPRSVIHGIVLGVCSLLSI